ncbi:hypothetical protein Tco_0748541 [Tanacetum coccineum]|uniref:Uncharacterized protein n=1 Tax=Tanacetum coccineum TaxID=301880 RepID=A0ABQ4YYN8_9ASTR
MANLKYLDKHNMVAFLKKPNESVGFTEVVDFLKGTSLRTLANGTQQLEAYIDSKEYTITEASVKSKLQLADATGIHNLSDAEIYAGIATLGYVTEGAAVDQGNTSGSAEDSMQLKELMVLVPTLVTWINSLEKELKETKQTLGNVVLKLVKKVKSLEKALKRKSKKALISESEGEEPEDQGRKIQDIDDDPLVSLVRESMKEKSIDFVTATKASGEAQEEEISPTILEAAKTLSKVASQGVSKEKSTDKGKRYRRRARSMAKKIDTGLDAEEEINTSREEINTVTPSNLSMQRNVEYPKALHYWVVLCDLRGALSAILRIIAEIKVISASHSSHVVILPLPILVHSEARSWSSIPLRILEEAARQLYWSSAAEDEAPYPPPTTILFISTEPHHCYLYLYLHHPLAAELIFPRLNHRSEEVLLILIDLVVRLGEFVLLCETVIGESSAAAAARQPGPTIETRLRDTERRMMTALEMVNRRVSYQVDVRSRESSEFHTRHHDAQKDRAAVRAEIEVLRRERLAYEQESIQTRQDLARSEAHCRALEARVTVLETEVRRHEWQRQAADDLAVQHIMRTQALEAGARVDTLEDTGSSS